MGPVWPPWSKINSFFHAKVVSDKEIIGINLFERHRAVLEEKDVRLDVELLAVCGQVAESQPESRPKEPPDVLDTHHQSAHQVLSPVNLNPLTHPGCRICILRK